MKRIKYFAVFLLIYLLIPALVFVYLWNKPEKQEASAPTKVEEVKRITKSEYLEKAVNAKRAEKGLNELKHDDALCKIASERKSEIKVEYSHDEFREKYHGTGQSNKYNWNWIGENLYRNTFIFADWNEPLNLWIESPTHNENMFDPIWTRTCLICDNFDCVQIFADAPPAKPE